MASQIQPIISKPSAVTQRPPITVHVPITPLWVPLMMIVVTTLSVAALALTLLKGSPETVAAPAASTLNITASDTAPIEEGKELQVKISELERNLAQAKTEIQTLKEQMLNVSSNVDGMNANLALVQAQASKNTIPVNILPPDSEKK